MVKKKRTHRGRGSSYPGNYGHSSSHGAPRGRRRRRPPQNDQAPSQFDGEPIAGEELEGGVADEAGLVEGAPTDAPPPPSEPPLTEFIGILELHPNGYGFLRSGNNNYSRERTDPFVPGTMIDRFGLRQGVKIRALVQPARRQQGPRVREMIDVDGMSPEDYLNVKSFDSKTAINPEEWLRLEVGQTPITNRVIDLLSPLGKGQRALIVAPPRSGKTIMLQDISRGFRRIIPRSN